MAELRPKIVKLCHIVGGMTGVVNKIDENAPEYYSLASIVTDDEADVAIACGLRKEQFAGAHGMSGDGMGPQITNGRAAAKAVREDLQKKEKEGKR